MDVDVPIYPLIMALFFRKSSSGTEISAALPLHQTHGSIAPPYIPIPINAAFI